MNRLRTERLLLRRWQESDVEPFATMCACPHVMEFFPKLLTLEETKAMIGRIDGRFEAQGFGLWAVEIIASCQFIGFVGLQSVPFEAHFTPAVEVGWRVAYAHWGKGYAVEAAKEALRVGFEQFDLPEIVSITSTANNRSMRVMEKLAMTTKPEDNFLSPVIAQGHPLQPHVLYRLTRGDWEKTRA
jgi:RimJ/RimL family protein N-acetyltransferase